MGISVTLFKIRMNYKESDIFNDRKLTENVDIVLVVVLTGTDITRSSQ